MDTLSQIATEGAALEGGALPAAGDPLPADVGLDTSAAPAPAGDADIQAAGIWAMLPQTLGSVLAMAMPELKEVYTADACAQWGRAMVPVAKKYGWNIGPDSPELALLAVSTPFIIGTGTAIVRRKAQARQQGGERPAAPGRPAPAAGAARNPIAEQAGAVLPPQLNGE